MYQSECTPKKVRGVVISMYQLFITLGILLASCINLGTTNIHSSASWRITIAIGMVWPLVLGIGIQFLDESPHWDIRRNRVERK
jgi:SP family sugar:H+ symporter-like MFS transporter